MIHNVVLEKFEIAGAGETENCHLLSKHIFLLSNSCICTITYLLCYA